MKKFICIALISSFVALFYLFISFVLANVLYNFDNGVDFFDFNILIFFHGFNAKEVRLFLLMSLINFVIIYLRYKDH